MVEGAVAQLGPRTGHRERLIIEQDDLWIRAEAARSRGETEIMKGLAADALEKNQELWADHKEPVAVLYAAAIYQYFLGDMEHAREMYAQLRDYAPSLYPPYFEEVKLLSELGGASRTAEAARLLWTYIDCNPNSPMLVVAREDAKKLELVRPDGDRKCDR